MNPKKYVSYMLLGAFLISSFQPLAAAQPQAKTGLRGAIARVKNSANEAKAKLANKLDQKLKALTKAVLDYKRCVVSGEGCSREKKIALRTATAAVVIVVALLLGGWIWHLKQKRAAAQADLNQMNQAIVNSLGDQTQSLYEAITQNDKAGINDALIKGADLLGKDKILGAPMIHYAVENGDEKFVQDLIEVFNVRNKRNKKPTITFSDVANLTDSKGITTAMKAARSKNKILFNFLKDSAGVADLLRFKDSEGKTVFMYAVIAKNYEGIREIFQKLENLLDQSTSPINIQDNEGKTALMHAIIADNDKEIIDTILNLIVVNPNIQDKVGKTALMHAAELGKKDVVEKMIRKRISGKVADKTIKDNDGKTAADLAANDEIKKLLQ